MQGLMLENTSNHGTGAVGGRAVGVGRAFVWVIGPHPIIRGCCKSTPHNHSPLRLFINDVSGRCNEGVGGTDCEHCSMNGGFVKKGQRLKP